MEGDMHRDEPCIVLRSPGQRTLPVHGYGSQASAGLGLCVDFLRLRIGKHACLAQVPCSEYPLQWIGEMRGEISSRQAVSSFRKSQRCTRTQSSICHFHGAKRFQHHSRTDEISHSLAERCVGTPVPGRGEDGVCPSGL